MAWKGKFRPKNPEKYAGDVNDIVYRSRLELRLMSWLDEHPDVVAWASEELAIPYVSPKDNKVHRYYPDMLVRKRLPDGRTEVLVVEVKPERETREPVPPRATGTRARRRFLREVATWGVNSAKWAAAEAFCADRGWRFVKLTERDINGRAGS